jgi:hypothetical protein
MAMPVNGALPPNGTSGSSTAVAGDEVVKAAGKVGTFEGRHLSRAVWRRVLDISLVTWLAIGLAFFALTGLAILLATAIAGEGWVRLVVLVLCLVLVVRILYGMKSLGDQAVRRRWHSRGIPRELTLTYAVTNEGLSASSELGRGLTYWASIDEVSPAGDYWLFFSAGGGSYLPRRFFASLAAERAFIRAILERVTSDARQRSRKAEKFLSGSAVG